MRYKLGYTIDPARHIADCRREQHGVCPLSARNSTYRLVQILEAGSVCHDGSYRFWEWDDEECDFTPLAIIALPLPVSNPVTDG